jgi:hypothetical protein
VEKITGANEPLLSVVVALARHSPGAADAVMKCPRLMDSIIQQFFLMDDELDAEVDALRPAHTKAIELLKVHHLLSKPCGFTQLVCTNKGPVQRLCC